MRLAFVLFLLANTLPGQQKQPAPPAAEAEKPDPRQKARELLDLAAKTVTAARPEVQVSGLLHLGEIYDVFDKTKALEFLDQAFAAAAGMPESSEDGRRSELQTVVVSTAADVSVDKAIEMLLQMTPPSDPKRDRRTQAVEKIVRLLLEKKDIDRAIQVVDAAGVSGGYPFRAAGQIFQKLPPEDPRRIQVFGNATNAFTSRPNGPFGDLLARHWREIPPSMAETALRALVNSILDRQDDGPFAQTLATSKGTVSLNSRQDAELFNLIHALRELDPKRADEILDKRPELRGAVERFPQGVESMMGGKDDGVSTSTSSGRAGDKRNPGDQQRMQLHALASSRASEATQALTAGDPQKALSIAKMIPMPSVQAQVLASVARSVGEKDPATAKSILTQCIQILDEIKTPVDRVGIWEAVAEAAHRAKEDDRAWEAIDRAMTDAAALYKEDTDADRPNAALREYWPSTQHYRAIVHRAANLFGVDAEPLLEKIADPDMRLLATIDMAQSLLGRQRRGMTISISRPPKR